jgi:hypothetical protein
VASWEGYKVPFMQRGDTWLTLIGVDLETKTGEHAAEITFHHADGSFDTIDVTRHCPCFKTPIRLSAYRIAGLSVQRAKLISANALGGGRDYQFTQTASGPLKYEVSVALRRASMLSCCFLGGCVGETRQLEHDP